jgi:AcrR family transcriptional regulator
MAARGSLADSQATRAALLDAARELFASEGIEAASLRAIQRRAGVAAGTLQYHFQSKDDLLGALVAREHAGINRKVTARAAALVARSEPPNARDIVSAIGLPYIEFVDTDPTHGPRYLMVLAQLVSKDSTMVRKLIGEVGTLFPQLLARAYPYAGHEEAAGAIAVAGRTLLFLLADHTVDADALIRFVAGGLDAMLAEKR